jgi:hypothetical protein
MSTVAESYNVNGATSGQSGVISGIQRVGNQALLSVRGPIAIGELCHSQALPKRGNGLFSPGEVSAEDPVARIGAHHPA